MKLRERVYSLATQINSADALITRVADELLEQVKSGNVYIADVFDSQVKELIPYFTKDLNFPTREQNPSYVKTITLENFEGHNEIDFAAYLAEFEDAVSFDCLWFLKDVSSAGLLPEVRDVEFAHAIWIAFEKKANITRDLSIALASSKVRRFSFGIAVAFLRSSGETDNELLRWLTAIGRRTGNYLERVSIDRWVEFYLGVAIENKALEFLSEKQEALSKKVSLAVFRLKEIAFRATLFDYRNLELNSF